MPNVILFDAKLIREVFTKYRVYEKSHSNPLISLLVTGLVGHEGDKWVKHRRIIDPAFHVEKMKVSNSHFCMGFMGMICPLPLSISHVMLPDYVM